jgi:hypothetical protein
MKKGKTSQLHGFKTAKVIYGTVDSVNLKSLYLNIQTWVEPYYDSDNWNRTVLNLSRGVKHSVYDSLNKKLFDIKFIVDLDLRSSGLSLGKKSFMNIEVNFFLIEENLDFKSKQIKDSLIKITNQIFIDNFHENNYFKFYLTKKVKYVDNTLQTENV